MGFVVSAPVASVQTIPHVPWRESLYKVYLGGPLSEQEVGDSAPAGDPVRLGEKNPREHCEVSLPRLRPKAVCGQGPAGQPKGCWVPSTASWPRPPGGQGWMRAYGVERAPRLLARLPVRPGLCPLRSWGAARPLLAPAGEELAAPQGPGAGLGGSADYRCRLIKERTPFVFLAPARAPWGRLELGAGLSTRGRAAASQGAGEGESLASHPLLLPHPKPNKDNSMGGTCAGGKSSSRKWSQVRSQPSLHTVGHRIPKGPLGPLGRS